MAISPERANGEALGNPLITPHRTGWRLKLRRPVSAQNRVFCHVHELPRKLVIHFYSPNAQDSDCSVRELLELAGSKGSEADGHFA
jgi:hypothetical protein